MDHLYHSSLQQEKFDAIVIGSGLGGLTTATLLAKSNKKVLVLEKHYVPGGFTHTFRRKDYWWDVGVHYVGQVNKEKALMRKVFDYVTDGQLQWSFMGQVYDKAVIEGQEYDFVCGEENQVREWLKHFPEEETAIRKYIKLVRRMGPATGMFFGERCMPPLLSQWFGFLLRFSFYKYSDKTTYEVLRGLTDNEKLIAVLCAQCGNYGLSPRKSSFAIQAMIAEHYLDGGNYPVGGASAIHRTVLQTFFKHGGVLALKGEVDQVLLEQGRATGVLMKNGDILRASVVVSNAGAHNTFGKLLPEGYLPKVAPRFSKELQEVKSSVAHICLYVGLDLSDRELNLPQWNYWLYSNYRFDEAHERFLSDPLSDPPLAYISFPSAKDPQWAADKPGKATIQVVCAASYEWVRQWEQLRWQKRGEDYETFKEHFRQRLLEKLYRVVPQIKGHVVVSELSTPLSTRHFSNYQQGEIYGLEHTPRRFRMRELRVHTPIKNLYLTGQDLVTVGVGGALFSGVLTATSILNRNFIWKALRFRKPEGREESSLS